ncbi:MAG: DUF58 domain-containing protein [Chitinophagaceae bacterium]|jgi:uncharacterized protein (DUF58 family)
MKWPFFNKTPSNSELVSKTSSNDHSDLVTDEQLPALLRKVRQIEIKTKGLSNHIFSGEYHSAFKGRGMSFSEVREYSYGDDVRSIDWNVTARFRSPFIKVFEEERELTLMLIVDISASSLFGTKKLNKRELITEICAVLAFSAISNNDKVGVILFSDRIEKYIPPKKGKSHILFIIRELLSIQAHKKSSTNIEEALKFMNAVMKKRCISFLLSDFISPDFDQALKLTAKKHDLIGIQVYDERDTQFPDIGLVQVQDAESGIMQWIDSSSAQFRQAYAQSFLKHETQTTNAFRKSGSSLLSIRTDDDYIKKLQVFFKGR